MPILVKNQNINTNKTFTFDFGSRSVLTYVVGISYWNYTFGSNDHHLKTISMSLSTNQPSATQVAVTVNAALLDASGNVISNSSSNVRVSCIAVVDGADFNLAVANANGIPSGSASGAIALPSSSLSIGSSFLSGFNLSFGNSDHHIKSLAMTAGFNQNGSSATITSSARMQDDSGNTDSSASINGGLVGASTGETGLLGRAQVNQQTSGSVSVDFGRPISDGVALLQSYSVTFGSNDHHVKTIGGGSDGWRVDGNKLVLNNAYAFITDDSGNHQKDSDSSVSMIVFAIPA